MVNIVGNVSPQDDYTHPLGPEENFNESVYFNFLTASRAAAVLFASVIVPTKVMRR